MKYLIRKVIFAAKESEIWDVCLACLACYHQEHLMVIIDSSEIMKPALHLGFIVCNFNLFSSSRQLMKRRHLLRNKQRRKEVERGKVEKDQ